MFLLAAFRRNEIKLKQNWNKTRNDLAVLANHTRYPHVIIPPVAGLARKQLLATVIS